MTARIWYERKVELLEQWAAVGNVPNGFQIPEGPASLRRWAEPSLDLIPWTSPTVYYKYVDLRARFEKAIRTLLKPRKSPRVRDSEIKSLKHQVTAITERNVLVEHQLDKLARQLKIERDERLRAEGKVQSLTRQLNMVLPMRQVEADI